MSRTPEQAEEHVGRDGGMFVDGTVWWRGKRYSLLALRALALILSDARGERFYRRALRMVEKRKSEKR